MKKRNLIVLSIITAGAAGVGTYLLKDKSNRIRLKEYMKMPAKEKDNRLEDDFPIHKAGHPHPENVPDNEMVSEGAQFGVQYYNRLRQDEE